MKKFLSKKQALGIAVSRIFTSSLLVQSYFARIFNFITYLNALINIMFRYL